VTNLPGVGSLTVRLNGQPFTRFAAVGRRTIEITSTIDTHQFEIVTGYRGDGQRAAMAPPSEPRRVAAAAASLLPSRDDEAPLAGDALAMEPGCPCCAGARNPE
jgi:hypothetical protein